MFGNITTLGSALYPHGGQIQVSVGNLANSAAGSVGFDASGFNSGNGGSVAVNLLAQTAAINLANSSGGFRFISNSGATGGNGGSLTVTIAGRLPPLSIPALFSAQAVGANGNGGSLSFTAPGMLTVGGSSSMSCERRSTGNGARSIFGAATLQIQQNLSADGGTLAGTAVVSISPLPARSPLTVERVMSSQQADVGAA